VARAALHEPFATLDQQAHAVRLAVWVFLASELMLFAALLGLYSGLRSAWPESFRRGILGNDVALGTLNTAILITSSLLVALALDATRTGRARRTASLLGGSIVLGGAFLVVKAIEYRHHFEEGVWPGVGSEPGLVAFHNIYFASTGLHALHVIAGMTLLGWLGVRAARGDFGPERSEHVPLELGGLYWHLVDVIWIFLWPLFYLLR
jgi:cytochrome c oxidase subunit 3